MTRSRLGIWHYIKSYKFNSILMKTFFLIIIPTVVPLILICTAIYNYYSTNLHDEIITANENALSKIKNMVDLVVLESDKLSSRLATDSDIQLLLSYPPINTKDFYTWERFQNLYKIMGIITTTNDVINSVYTYFEQSDFVLATDGYSMDFEHFPDKDWINNYTTYKGKTNYWVIPRKVNKPFQSTTQNFISTFRTISNYNFNGVIIVNIDIQKLKNVIDTVNDRKLHNLLIVDDKGTIVYNTDVSIISKNIKEIENFKYLSLNSSNSFAEDTNGTKQIVTVLNSDYNKWRYVLITPISQYSERTEEFKNVMFAGIAISLLVAIGTAFLIAIRVFQPIKNMVNLLDEPQAWAGIIKIDDEKNFNEFKYVAKSILSSMDRTRQMEETLAERLSLLRKAQSVALQAQINPHFLYNTLETINWKAMALTGGDNEVSGMLASLSELLRLSLETQNNLVSVKTEVEHAQLYLDIQKIRYKDKFDVVWKVDDNILDYKIVKLTLQPLIENAIYHGIKPKKDRGTITIEGIPHESHIMIRIIDDGVGLSEEEVEELNSGMGKSYIKEDLHIGMRNVNQRIKLVFGDAFGLSIESKYKKYTIVNICIPMVE